MSLEACLDDVQLLALVDSTEADPVAMAHLQVCPACRERLDRLREELAAMRDTAQFCRDRATSLPSTPSSPSSDNLPKSIGPYLVLEWLGRGGEADVFRAEHPVLRHNVALKWSRRAFQGSVEPLVEEGRLLASLDVSGVARVFDLGLHEGRPYLVMQMLRGRTLHRYTAEAALSPREKARLVAEIARILARAHANHIWHRDLKPSNILIDGEGKPTIIDFGMAGFCQPWRDDAPCSGGTLQFMAPEQAKEILGVCGPEASSPAVGPRSDIFALGAVLYSLLTERAPYPRGTSPELIERVCRGDIDRDALTVARVPPRLARICLKAMACDPAHRYGSANEMANDLERFVRPPRRKRWLGAAIAVVLVVALAAVASRSGSPPLSASSPARLSQPAFAQPATPPTASAILTDIEPATPSPQPEQPMLSAAEQDESRLEERHPDKVRRPRRFKGRAKEDASREATSKGRWVPRLLKGRGAASRDEKD
jgi:eukaryotic-like serine/threonine-protein kinase